MQQLRWKLALSYIGVTVGTLLVAQLAVLLWLAPQLEGQELGNWGGLPAEQAPTAPVDGATSVPQQALDENGNIIRYRSVVVIPGVLLTSIVCLIVPIAVVGGVFGVLTARWMTRRLSTMQTVADHWGAGQFSARIADTAPDEIGAVSRNLDAMAAQLETLVATRQHLAALDERTRIALDLHDGVKQQVFAASMNLGTARLHWDTQSDEAQRRLALAEEQLYHAQQDLSQLIQALRPPPGETGTALLEQVRTTVERWQAHSGLETELHTDDAVSVPAPLHEVVLRVLQEALSNVAKHSGATHVAVRLEQQADELLLVVGDNGRGFAVDSLTTGLGLHGMRERAARAGGTCRITSSAAGTHVELRVPWKENE